MKIAVIVLNWNGVDDALECIDSLISQTANASIIIVDNNSSDDSVERFKSYQKEHADESIFLLENSQNLGFAGGINSGIRYVFEKNFEFIGVLNPDAVADSQWLENLLEEFKNPKVGVATGLMLRRDGKTVDSSGDFYTTWGLPGPRNRDEPASNTPTEPG